MRLRTIAVVIWPCALVGWLYDKTAHLGFNVADEGLIASYARRILAGQVPHRDFISPRPIGSSILHLPDLLIPMPFYLAERLVGITVVVAYSLVVGWLVFRRPPTQWGIARSAGVAAAALVNLHTFLETPWYTYDGLFLSALAFVLLDAALRRESRRTGLAAFLVAGLAVTTKQSFAPAPLVMLVWLFFARRGHDQRGRVRELVAAALAAALPMLLYTLVIAAFGGLGELVDQLTSGRVVWGRALFEILGLSGPGFGRPTYAGHFPWEVALAAAALCVASARRAPSVVRAALALIVVVLVGRLCFHQHLDRTEAWSLEVMWAYILVLAVQLVFTRRIPLNLVLVLALAWMSMLSWGYDVPAMAAGSMVLATVVWAFETAQLTRVRATLVAPAVAVLGVGLFVFTAAQEIDARERQPYFDRPARELTLSVSRFSSDFRGIKTSKAVFSYLQGLSDCRKRYPAHWIAVLPDNPGLYHALGMHNPFPVDWFLRQDLFGQRGRIVAAARTLNARGDYLVLFQTVSGFFLNKSKKALPPATRQSVPFMAIPGFLYDAGTADAIINSLHGRRVVCGSFLGIWSPAVA